MSKHVRAVLIGWLAVAVWLANPGCPPQADDDFNVDDDATDDDDTGDDDTSDDDDTTGDDDDSTGDDDDTTGDDDDSTGDDDTTGDDDDSTGDDDTTGDDDATGDDDTTGDDDDSTGSPTIDGTIEVGVVTPTSPPPWEMGWYLYDPANFDPTLGPTGPPMDGNIFTVNSLPAPFLISTAQGQPVYVTIFVDDNQSGLQFGPDPGDVYGFHPSPVTAPATNITIALDHSL